MNREEKVKRLLLLREKKIRLSRNSLWEYCKTTSPDFYKDSRPHLKTIIDTLQGIYEGTLLKADGTPYKKLMMSVPCRHGKSRSLINLCAWAFGKNKSERVITGSYNDELATDFSKYTRNTIQEGKQRPEEIVYSDIFPATKIKYGDASYKQWSLEGEFFSYKGAGIGGSVTGKGATILIGDDLVKDAATAYSEVSLDTIWLWYTGTFLSRAEEGSIQILCMTRWSKNDPIGRILDSETKDDWYILEMEAFDGENMLCPELLSKESYNTLKINMDNLIFRANYHNETIEAANSLYPFFKEYDVLPEKIEYVMSCIDTADTGSDYLAMITAAISEGYAYVLDIYYTKDPMEITEPEVARRLYEYKVNVAHIESNNGGRGFSRNVERLLYANHKSRNTLVKWFHQSQNKISRILSNATNVVNTLLFPKGWKQQYKESYEDLSVYQREGKNKNDDIEDVCTMLVEKLDKKGFRFL